MSEKRKRKKERRERFEDFEGSSGKSRKRYENKTLIDSISDLAYFYRYHLSPTDIDTKSKYEIYIKDHTETDDKNNLERLDEGRKSVQNDSFKRLFGTRTFFSDFSDTQEAWREICMSMNVYVIWNEADWREYTKRLRTWTTEQNVLTRSLTKISELKILWDSFNYIIDDYPPNLKILDLSNVNSFKEVNSLYFLPASTQKVILQATILEEQILPRNLPVSLKTIEFLNKYKMVVLNFQIPEQCEYLYRFNSLMYDLVQQTSDIVVYLEEDWNILNHFLFQYNKRKITKIIMEMFVLKFEIREFPLNVLILDLSYIESYTSELKVLEQAQECTLDLYLLSRAASPFKKETYDFKTFNKSEFGKHQTIILNEDYYFPLEKSKDVSCFNVLIRSIKTRTIEVGFLSENKNLGSYLNMRKNAKTKGSVTISNTEEWYQIWAESPMDWWSNVKTLHILQLDNENIENFVWILPANLKKLYLSEINGDIPKFLSLLSSLPKSLKQLYLPNNHRFLFPVSFQSYNLDIHIGEHIYILPSDFRMLQEEISANEYNHSHVNIDQSENTNHISQQIKALNNLNPILSNNDVDLLKMDFRMFLSHDALVFSKQYFAFIPMYLYQCKIRDILNSKKRKIQSKQKQEIQQEIKQEIKEENKQSKKGEDKLDTINKIFVWIVWKVLSLEDNVFVVPQNGIFKIPVLLDDFEIPIPLTKSFEKKIQMILHSFITDEESGSFMNRTRTPILLLCTTFVSLLYVSQKNQTIERLERELVFFQTIPYPLSPTNIPPEYEIYLQSLSLCSRTLCVLQHLFLYFRELGSDLQRAKVDWAQRMRLIFVPNQPLSKVSVQSNEHGHPIFSLSPQNLLKSKMKSEKKNKEYHIHENNKNNDKNKNNINNNKNNDKNNESNNNNNNNKSIANEDENIEIKKFIPPHPLAISNDFETIIRTQQIKEKLNMFQETSQSTQINTFQRALDRQRSFLTHLINHTLFRFSTDDMRDTMWGRYGDEDIALLYQLDKDSETKMTKTRNPYGLYCSFVAYQIFFFLLRMSKPVFKKSCVLFRGISRLGNKQLVSNIADFLEKDSHENKNNLMTTLKNILHDRQSSLFTATSASFEVGRSFTQKAGGGTRILFKYHLPAFYPFLVLNGFFQSKFLNEYELLLPVDHRWKVTNVQVLSSVKTEEHLLLVDLRLDLEEDKRQNKDSKENKENDSTMKDEKVTDLYPSYFPESKLNHQEAYHELNILLHDWIFETLKTKQKDSIVLTLIEQRNSSSYKFFGLFQKFITQCFNLSTPVIASRFQVYTETQVDLKLVKDMDLLFYVLYQRKGTMNTSQKWLLQQKQINSFKTHPETLNCLKDITTNTFVSLHTPVDEWKDIDPLPCSVALMEKSFVDKEFSFSHLLKKRVLYFDSQIQVEQFCKQVEEMSSSIFHNNLTFWKTLVENNNTKKHIPWILYFCWYWEIEVFVWKQNSNLYASQILYRNVSPVQATNNSMNQTL